MLITTVMKRLNIEYITALTKLYFNWGFDCVEFRGIWNEKSGLGSEVIQIRRIKSDEESQNINSFNSLIN